MTSKLIPIFAVPFIIVAFYIERGFGDYVPSVELDTDAKIQSRDVKCLGNNFCLFFNNLPSILRELITFYQVFLRKISFVNLYQSPKKDKNLKKKVLKKLEKKN